MGVSWDSHAEVISLEPEKIKQLIEEIDNDDNYDTSSVNDLRIEDNSVFFNSGGYGCYGYDEGDRDLLFQKLLEKYEGAIACFEYVQPCQSQNFYFAVTYVKSETEQSTHLFVFVMEEDEDYDVRTDESHWDYVESSSYPYPSFDREEVFIWAIPTRWLEDNSSLVSLNSIYKKCGNNELKITHSLINSWWDDGAISEDEYYSAMEESKSYCVESLKDSWSLLFEEFESSLPSNFPSFKTDSGS
ncbi:MAG: hypothetical protein GW795_12580 [Cyanobacteria bacterium]|nr:hypothetical protein [Cyanobacteria bacterium CG_2015-16_32_12]NCO77552.1 hypothetical protein [Cyanobacteria bacterium CG_2015-22_32_23]NCQ05867.1 hypothetical protein [Cyanobacteria bacterium CG_2015-09_32_10]NCQ42679.1 hypothetical protein [Cyanobacteria bacterium CG_2015-04_32_10]NCS84593.1 hypothetical protein [Cyanobacteria bacterium CG_2015-02_32_10]